MTTSKRALHHALRPLEGEKRKRKLVRTQPPWQQQPKRGSFGSKKGTRS